MTAPTNGSLADEYAALVTFGSDIGTASIPPAMSARILEALRTPPAQVGAATDSGEGVQQIKLALQANDALEFSRFEGPYPGEEWIKQHHDMVRSALNAALASPTKPVADSVEAVAKLMHEADPDVGCTWEQWVAYAEAHPTHMQAVEFVRRQARAVVASMPSSDQEGLVEARKIETVTGDFMTEPGEPFWRIEINGYCADFDSEQAAHNFAAQINGLTRARQMGSEGA